MKCGVAAQREPQRNSPSRDKLLLSRQLEHLHARDLTATHRKMRNFNGEDICASQQSWG